MASLAEKRAVASVDYVSQRVPEEARQNLIAFGWSEDGGDVLFTIKVTEDEHLHWALNVATGELRAVK